MAAAAPPPAESDRLQPQPSPANSPSHAAMAYVQAQTPNQPLGLQSWQLEIDRTGVSLHYVTSRPSAPCLATVLFVHGWPDCWFGWRKQVAAFTAAGYRCVLVDQRGFGESLCVPPSARTRPESYTHQLACKDLELLCRAEGVKRVIVIGHDWGGAVAWAFARRYPSLCQAVVALCTPYRPRKGRHMSVEDVAALMPAFQYQVYFARRRADAVREFERDPSRLLAALFRSGTKGDGGGGALMNAKSAGFLAHFPPKVTLSPMMTPAEIDIYLSILRVSGFESGLCWYATSRLNWEEDLTNVRDEAFDVRRGSEWNALPSGSANANTAHVYAAPVDPVSTSVSQPALMVSAGRDFILHPKMSVGMEEWVPLLQRLYVEGAAHWVQMEKAQEVNEGILKFLASLSLKEGAVTTPPTAAPAAKKATAPRKLKAKL